MTIVQPNDLGQRRQALAALVTRPAMTPNDVQRSVDLLLHYADSHGLSLEHCLMALQEDRCTAACLCVDAPGRTSSVFLPAGCDRPAAADATIQLLKEASRQAHTRGIQFLQGMVAPECAHESAVYRQAGFEELTQLIYLEADSTRPLTLSRPAPAVTWTAYRPETHQSFADTVLGTYEDSLDCGSLNGIRDIEDILASHRGVGEFNPDLWLLGTLADRPVGVILLAHLPDRWSYEVVYMGLLKAWRGRGFATTLLHRAFELARAAGILTVTLTVDERNDPALKLYRRFRFQEIARRKVWIHLLNRTVGKPPP